MTEDQMVGWHHQLNGHEFGQAQGVGDVQGGLACCSPWGHKESDTTEQLNWTELKKESIICWQMFYLKFLYPTMEIFKKLHLWYKFCVCHALADYLFPYFFSSAKQVWSPRLLSLGRRIPLLFLSIIPYSFAFSATSVKIFPSPKVSCRFSIHLWEAGTKILHYH